jgi:hypothetical protein
MKNKLEKAKCVEKVFKYIEFHNLIKILKLNKNLN